MKTMFTTIRLTLFFTILAQVLSAQTIPGKFLIEGDIHDVKDGSLVKLVDIDQQVVLDSAYSKDNKFKLQGHVGAPTTCWLQCAGEYAILQVENVPMKFDSPLKDLRLNYFASAGREQGLQNELNKLQRPYDRIYLSAYDSLNNKLYTNDLEKKRLVKVFNDAQDQSMKIYVDFGKRNVNSCLGLDIVYRNRKAIPKSTVDSLYNSLEKPYKSSPKGNALNIFLHDQIVKKGGMMVDFQARSITGKPFKLSSLKGKYIYLSFGSAGCGPCRMENKEISKNFDRLSKLMEIVYFSLDKNRDYWKMATREDKIVWTNVSDMGGDYGKVKTIYDVQSMPTSFLIDKNGVIIKKIEWYDTDTLTNIEKMIREAKD